MDILSGDILEPEFAEEAVLGRCRFLRLPRTPTVLNPLPLPPADAPGPSVSINDVYGEGNDGDVPGLRSFSLPF